MTQGEESVESWAPIVGRWDVHDPKKAIYLGHNGEELPPFGVCISNIRFSEGVAKVTVKLPKDDGNAALAPAGRLLLGYRSWKEDYYSVGLGGYGCAYVLSHFRFTTGWAATHVAGNIENLARMHPYKLAVRVQGQRIAFDVDGVRVLEHVLDTPLMHGPLGLFTWGLGGVEFADVVARKERGTVFVAMQFAEPYQELYADVIQPVAEHYGLRAYHAGELFKPGVIMEDIVRGIEEAKIIIAEITPANQNVFYELGYAHALGKPTILLAKRGRDLPFDVKGFRCLFYEDSIGGKRDVEDGLHKHLRSIVETE